MKRDPAWIEPLWNPLSERQRFRLRELLPLAKAQLEQDLFVASQWLRRDLPSYFVEVGAACLLRRPSGLNTPATSPDLGHGADTSPRAPAAPIRSDGPGPMPWFPPTPLRRARCHRRHRASGATPDPAAGPAAADCPPLDGASVYDGDGGEKGQGEPGPKAAEADQFPDRQIERWELGPAHVPDLLLSCTQPHGGSSMGPRQPQGQIPVQAPGPPAGDPAAGRDTAGG